MIDEHVDLPSTRVASGAVNPVGKLTSIIAAMACGADSIDDADVLRAGGSARQVSRFGEVGGGGFAVVGGTTATGKTGLLSQFQPRHPTGVRRGVRALVSAREISAGSAIVRAAAKVRSAPSRSTVMARNDTR
ncbi:MAG: hypothetical protein K2X97_17245 [Mycobacteriaceae bacterium]|nr:hypothetical protein [Mycobacteriaceae bacterium]